MQTQLLIIIIFFLIKTERVVGSVMVMTLNHGAVMFMAQA